MQELYEELFADLQAIIGQNGDRLKQETSEVALQGYSQAGRGCVQIDLTEYRQSIKNAAQSGTEHGSANINYYYWPREKFLSEQNILKNIDDYNPESEFVVICTDCTNPKETIMVGFIDTLYQQLKPANISPEQIRKRVKRLLQGGVNSIVLSPEKNPEHAGDNLFEWVKQLKLAGIEFTIDSQQAIELPDDEITSLF